MSVINALRGLSILQHDFFLSDQCIERMDELADEIQAEIERDYMRLSVDKDGVPIMPDDVVVTTHDGQEYSVLAVGFGFWVDINGCTHASSCTVHRKRTIEDVLLDLVNDTAKQGHQIGLTAQRIVEKYAAEIRELLGGSE